MLTQDSMLLFKFYSLVCVLMWATLGASSRVDIAARQSSCPGFYDIGLGTVRIVHHRALERDSVYIGATLIITSPGNPAYNISNFYGKHGDGHFNSSITFSNVSVPDQAVAVLGYVIINLGHHHNQNQNKETVQNTAFTVAKNGVSAAPNYSPSETASNVIGAIPDVGGFFSDIIDIAQGCDGVVAAGLHLFSGASMCAGASDPLVKSTTLVGTDSYTGKISSSIACDLVNPSQYHVGYFAGANLNMTAVYSENRGSRLMAGIEGIWWAAGLGLLMLVLI
jgi:hypothetical protein